MKTKNAKQTQAIYAFAKSHPHGITPKDLTENLGIPAKAASDQMTHMALGGSLRRVRLPNRDAKRYRYFAVETYKPYERRTARAEGFGRYTGTPIPQMPIVRLS